MHLFCQRWCFAVLLCCFASAPHASDAKDCGLSAADASRVKALAHNIVERGHAPGVVLDLRCDGQPWLTHAAGMADAERQRAMRSDDLFRIYSMTKPITSLLVLMLADEGKLSIDDPLARHLPEFAQATVHDGSSTFPPTTVAPVRPLTVRDLLRHSAGMGYISPAPHPVHRLYVQRGIDNGGGQVFTPTDGSAPVASSADLVARIAATPLLSQPGQRFTYGNSTDVLGRLVEVLTGQRLRDAMQERLLAPLRMHDSFFEVPPEKLPRLTAAYSSPSQLKGDGGTLRVGDLPGLARSALQLVDDPQKSVFARRRAVDFGGAGLVSTAADYQQLLAMMLRGGEAPDQRVTQRIIRRDTLLAMRVNQLDASALAGSNLAAQGLGFGLGVAVFSEPARAPAALPQDGYFWGGAASTYFWVDPTRRITGVLMTQVFGGDVGPYFMALMNLLYAAEPVVTPAKK
jgi:CubicO group peptidase (beta-lactamase class C family)